MDCETYSDDDDLLLINSSSRFMDWESVEPREVERLSTSCGGCLLTVLESLGAFVFLIVLVFTVAGNVKPCMNNLILYVAALVVSNIQIHVASVVLNMAKDEYSQALLFTWLLGYICGCFASTYVCLNTYVQPFNKYNIRFRLDQLVTVEEPSTIVSGRKDKEMEVLKKGIACFFVVWLVLGIVWFCDGHSSFPDSHVLDRLCVVFIAFDCVRNTSMLVYCSHFFSSMVAKFRPSDCCCICLEKYGGGEARRLGCSHVFHLECIDKWLRINPTCPLCRS